MDRFQPQFPDIAGEVKASQLINAAPSVFIYSTENTALTEYVHGDISSYTSARGLEEKLIRKLIKMASDRMEEFIRPEQRSSQSGFRCVGLGTRCEMLYNRLWIIERPPACVCTRISRLPNRRLSIKASGVETQIRAMEMLGKQYINTLNRIIKLC